MSSETEVFKFLEKMDDKLDVMSPNILVLKQTMASVQEDVSAVKKDIDKIFSKLDETSKETTINAEAIKYATIERAQIREELMFKIQDYENLISTHKLDSTQYLDKLENNIYKTLRENKENIKVEVCQNTDNKILKTKVAAFTAFFGVIFSAIGLLVREAFLK